MLLHYSEASVKVLNVLKLCIFLKSLGVVFGYSILPFHNPTKIEFLFLERLVRPRDFSATVASACFVIFFVGGGNFVLVVILLWRVRQK